MDSLILLIFCFLFGIVSRKMELLPSSTPVVLNNFIINLSMPAVTFLYMHKMTLNTSMLYPVFMPWLVFGMAVIFFKLIKKPLGLSDNSVGCLIMTTGLGNTSFVGFPMITAFFGAQYLGVGVLCDQPGSFMVLSTLGIATATMYAAGTVQPASLIKKVLTFPPFQALILAFALKWVTIPEVASSAMKTLGMTITPLAMVSVGYQLRFIPSPNIIKKLAAGLIFKLLLAPAFIYILYVLILKSSGKEIQVTLFEAAMAPMITAGIISMQYGLDEELATMLLGVGIPLSFLTLPVWYYLFSGV